MNKKYMKTKTNIKYLILEGGNMKVEAFFRGIKNANEAVDKLKSKGIKAYADINDHYEENTEEGHGGFIPTSKNSDLVLNAGMPSGNTGSSPMAAASPMVSGMGGFEEIADINCKVVVETDANNEGKAEEMLKSLGGEMRSPNLNIQKHIRGVDFSKADKKFMENIQQ